MKIFYLNVRTVYNQWRTTTSDKLLIQVKPGVIPVYENSTGWMYIDGTRDITISIEPYDKTAARPVFECVENINVLQCSGPKVILSF